MGEIDVRAGDSWRSALLAGCTHNIVVDTYLDTSAGVARPVVCMPALRSGDGPRKLADMFRIAGSAAMRGCTTVIEADLGDIASACDVAAPVVSRTKSEPDVSVDDVHSDVPAGASEEPAVVDSDASRDEFLAVGTPLGDVMSDLNALAAVRRGEGTGPAFEGGTCYQLLIRPEYRSLALGKYGTDFRCRDMHTIPCEWLRDAIELDGIGVTLTKGGTELHLEEGYGSGSMTAADLCAVVLRHGHVSDEGIAVLADARVGDGDVSIAHGSFSTALADVVTVPCWRAAIGEGNVCIDSFESLCSSVRTSVLGYSKVFVVHDVYAHIYHVLPHAPGVLHGRGASGGVHVLSLWDEHAISNMSKQLSGSTLCNISCTFGVYSASRCAAVARWMEGCSEHVMTVEYAEQERAVKRQVTAEMRKARDWMCRAAQQLELEVVTAVSELCASADWNPGVALALRVLHEAAASRGRHGVVSDFASAYVAVAAEYSRRALELYPDRVQLAGVAAPSSIFRADDEFFRGGSAPRKRLRQGSSVGALQFLARVARAAPAVSKRLRVRSAVRACAAAESGEKFDEAMDAARLDIVDKAAAKLYAALRYDASAIAAISALVRVSLDGA